MEKLSIGEKIKFARERAGLTQKELGEKVGVTGVTIMRYENNQRGLSYNMVSALSKVLGVSLLVDYDFFEMQKEDYRYSTAYQRASNAFYSVLESAYGKAKEYRGDEEIGLERYFVYENGGDPFALVDSDIDIIADAAFAVIERLVDNFRMTPQEADDHIKEVQRNTKKLLAEEGKNSFPTR